MTLVLTVLRCPDGARLETRAIEHGELSIGRGKESDWVLSDPERVLSKRHCLLARRGSAWELADISTNGTFLNHDPAPLGRNASRVLRDGDRLILGSYEIEVALRGRATPPLAEMPPTEAGEPPATDGTMGSAINLPDGGRFSVAMALPPDMDDSSIPYASPYPAADRAPAEAQHFRAPSVRFDILPPDWDQDAAPDGAPDAAPDAPAAQPALPAPAEAGKPDPPPLQPRAAAGGDAFAAFLAGAGVSAAPPDDVAEALREFGRAFRAMVSGLRRMMITRAAIKGEFRIERTMIRPSGNNPLKFSVDDDDAMQALLGPCRPSDMPAERAVGEAMRDMRLHELAVSTAMQQAARNMLAALAPEPLMRDQHTDALDKLPGAAARRKSRAWDAYAALHARTAQALSDDFESVFGRSFVRAYERAMAELRAQDDEHGGEHGGEP